MRLKLLVFLMVFSLIPSFALAQEAFIHQPGCVAYNSTGGDNVTVHIFFRPGCPHCAAEEPFLKSLEDEYDWLTVQYYDVEVFENAILYTKMADECGQSSSYVPGTIICGDLIVGYDSDQTTGATIRQKILSCRNSLTSNETHCSCQDKPDTAVNIPLFGQVDAKDMSLPALTIVIGFLDGFNPCAFFVLLFLLSLLIYTKSRSRMLLIGGIFVFFSALVYFIFMAAWLNLFLYLGELKMITFIAGLVALFVAAVNIKDFFWFKKGVSLTLSDSARKDLLSRMRSLVHATEMPSMIGGTIILAVVANSYELLCTAGFPMVYTRVLTLNQLPSTTYYTYLALYNIVYVIPLAAIVVFFSITLGSRKLKESEGRTLKLLSGNMMLFLGLILIFSPEQINSVISSVLIMVMSAVVTFMMLPLIKKE